MEVPSISTMEHSKPFLPSKSTYCVRTFKYPNVQLSKVASQAVLAAEENEHTFLCPLLSVTCQDSSSRNAPTSYIIHKRRWKEMDRKDGNLASWVFWSMPNNGLSIG